MTLLATEGAARACKLYLQVMKRHGLTQGEHRRTDLGAPTQQRGTAESGMKQISEPPGRLWRGQCMLQLGEGCLPQQCIIGQAARIQKAGAPVIEPFQLNERKEIVGERQSQRKVAWAFQQAIEIDIERIALCVDSALRTDDGTHLAHPASPAADGVSGTAAKDGATRAANKEAPRGERCGSRGKES